MVSVSPEVSVVPGGTASFGFQDPGKVLLFQPLAQAQAQAQPPYIPLNQSLTLLLSLTPLLPHSLKLTLDLNRLLALKRPQPLYPVPAPAPDAALGCPVQRGQAGPGWC